MAYERLLSHSDKLAMLFDLDNSIYDAFHDEDTLDYFKSLLAFDVAYKIKIKKS